MFRNEDNKKLYTAIVFFPHGSGKDTRKYRNVKPASFETFARILGAWYVNYYDSITKTYAGRQYIQYKT
jgi:hypothetical protein